MKQLELKPTIHEFAQAKDFVSEFNIGQGDLVITNQYIWENYFANLHLACDVIFQEKYGKGEPSDTMFASLVQDIKSNPKRVIGIGGGSVMDIAKVCALKENSPVIDLVDGKIAVCKKSELVLVPTTCGTGSEVTNIAVFSLTERNTKKGIAHDACYAEHAVLIPELLSTLPDTVLATSSLDALTHSIESALSPKASDLSKLFSYKACGLILNSYMQIYEHGKSAKKDVVANLLKASLLAGIAFSNAGCGCVHAMAYPLGGTFHIAHGETNAALLTSVLRYYATHDISQSVSPLKDLFAFMAEHLQCEKAKVLDKLDTVINVILPKKQLHEYGMTEDMQTSWAKSVVNEQQRLLQNSYLNMDEKAISNIYKSTF